MCVISRCFLIYISTVCSSLGLFETRTGDKMVSA